MPDKKSSKNSADDDVVEDGTKRPIIPILVSIIMLGAGYFVGGMMGGGSGDGAAASGEPTETTVEEAEHHELGELVPLEPININLQGGHFLRVAICLETHASGSGGHGGGDEAFPTAPAADLLLATFSGRTVEELSTIDGREHVRQELLDAVVERYDGEVYGLYFTEFVMQ